MKERILEFLRAENKTSAQFAEDIGVQPSGISHILSGRNRPSLDFVVKMLEKYKYISPEWLLFGKGNMYRDQSLPDLFSQLQEKDSDTKKDEEAGTGSVKEIFHPENISHDEDISGPAVEKIVWFYNNNTFREYYPEKE